LILNARKDESLASMEFNYLQKPLLRAAVVRHKSGISLQDSTTESLECGDDHTFDISSRYVMYFRMDSIRSSAETAIGASVIKAPNCEFKLRVTGIRSAGSGIVATFAG
jgi:hypothetical protein